jgi:hypothetical protein
MTTGFLAFGIALNRGDGADTTKGKRLFSPH